MGRTAVLLFLAGCLAACSGLPGLRALPGEGGGPTLTPPPALDAGTYARQLASFIETKDFEGLRGAMGSSFILAFPGGEGQELDPETALERLRGSYLTPGTAPEAVFDADLRGLLGEAGALAQFGAGASPDLAFLVRGLGPDAGDEALVILSQDAQTGAFSWRGMLAAAGGFHRDAGEALDQALALGLESRDFEALRSLMGPRFSFATWNTELLEVSPDEALERLQGGLLSPGSAPRVRFDSDIPALLGGVDPLSLWGPVANPVRAMHVTGLGPDAREEAVLVIGLREAGGEAYWHGILSPPGEAFQSAADPGTVLPTEVRLVRALEVLNLRSGPGTEYAVIALLSPGETAQVDGVSADGAWWRVFCPQDASGSCWLSADPELTEPLTGPVETP